MKTAHRYSRQHFYSFLKQRLNQRIIIDTVGGAIITGTLMSYTPKIIRLKDAHIILVSGETLFLHYITERICAVTIWGIPMSIPPPFMNEQVVTGQITDSNTNESVVGAFIRVVLIRDDKPIRVLGYTYSGCDGFYILTFDRSLVLGNDRVQIQIVGPPNRATPPSCN